MLRDKEGDILKMDVWMDGASSPTIKRVWKRIRADYGESTNSSHNRQITKPASCEDCEFDYASITCSTCAGWPANKQRQAS